MAIFNFARRARKLRCYTLMLLEISRRTRWWCLKCVKVYPSRDIRPFVMYCVNGKPRSSLLIESTDSMIHVRVCVTSSTLRTWRAVVDNIRWRIVGVMFLPSIFEKRCGDFRRSMWRLSKIDVSPFEDRRSMSRCVDLRRSMCRPSEIDVLTFEDRCVDLRRSMIDGRCVGLRRSMVDVKLGCYTCSKH